MTAGAKKGGLGRGLDALLYGESVDLDAGNRIVELPLNELTPGLFQPRTDWSTEALEELAESIRREGVISPIIVRPTGLGYEIVAGERRTRAARIAGIERIPAIVRDVDDKHAAAIALIENIQREDLNPLEEAEGLQRLMESFGFTHEEAAQAVGRSRSATTNLLRLLKLEDGVKAMVRSGEIDMGHARALLAVSGEMQLQAAEDVRRRGLSVRQTEALVKRMQNDGPEKPPRQRIVVKLRNDERLEERLAERLNAEVTVRSNEQGRGNIVIAFENLEHLAEIVRRMIEC